jgi:hypothetical protein
MAVINSNNGKKIGSSGSVPLKYGSTETRSDITRT